jgi:hypothetical protein
MSLFPPGNMKQSSWITPKLSLRINCAYEILNPPDIAGSGRFMFEKDRLLADLQSLESHQQPLINRLQPK